MNKVISAIKYLEAFCEWDYLPMVYGDFYAKFKISSFYNSWDTKVQVDSATDVYKNIYN